MVTVSARSVFLLALLLGVASLSSASLVETPEVEEAVGPAALADDVDLESAAEADDIALIDKHGKHVKAYNAASCQAQVKALQAAYEKNSAARRKTLKSLKYAQNRLSGRQAEDEDLEMSLDTSLLNEAKRYYKVHGAHAAVKMLRGIESATRRASVKELAKLRALATKCNFGCSGHDEKLMRSLGYLRSWKNRRLRRLNAMKKKVAAQGSHPNRHDVRMIKIRRMFYKKALFRYKRLQRMLHKREAACRRIKALKAAGKRIVPKGSSSKRGLPKAKVPKVESGLRTPCTDRYKAAERYAARLVMWARRRHARAKHVSIEVASTTHPTKQMRHRQAVLWHLYKIARTQARKAKARARHLLKFCVPPKGDKLQWLHAAHAIHEKYLKTLENSASAAHKRAKAILKSPMGRGGWTMVTKTSHKGLRVRYDPKTGRVVPLEAKGSTKWAPKYQWVHSTHSSKMIPKATRKLIGGFIPKALKHITKMILGKNSPLMKIWQVPASAKDTKSTATAARNEKIQAYQQWLKRYPIKVGRLATFYMKKKTQYYRKYLKDGGLRKFRTIVHRLRRFTTKRKTQLKAAKNAVKALIKKYKDMNKAEAVKARIHAIRTALSTRGYRPKNCPSGFARSASTGECETSKKSDKYQSCGVNMVLIDKVCRCRRGYHYTGKSTCSPNSPSQYTSRICKVGWFYHRHRCIKSCPKGYVADATHRTCTSPSKHKSAIKATRCGKGMTIKNGKCKCKLGFRKSTNGLFCLKYTKTFKHCRKGFYLSGRKCVRKCPKGYFPDPKTRKCQDEKTFNAAAAAARARAAAAAAAAAARARARALLRAQAAKAKAAHAAALKKARSLLDALRKARAAADAARIAHARSKYDAKAKKRAADKAKGDLGKIAARKARLEAALKRLLAQHKRALARLEGLLKDHKAAKDRAAQHKRDLEKALRRLKALKAAYDKAKAAALAKARKLAKAKNAQSQAALDAAKRRARRQAKALAKQQAAMLEKARARARALKAAMAKANAAAAALAAKRREAQARAAELAKRRAFALKAAKAKAAALAAKRAALNNKCKQSRAAFRKAKRDAASAARRRAAALAAAKAKAAARRRALQRARDAAKRRRAALARSRAKYLKALKAQGACKKVHCGCTSDTCAARAEFIRKIVQQEMSRYGKKPKGVRAELVKKLKKKLTAVAKKTITPAKVKAALAKESAPKCKGTCPKNAIQDPKSCRCFCRTGYHRHGRNCVLGGSKAAKVKTPSTKPKMVKTAPKTAAKSSAPKAAKAKQPAAKGPAISKARADKVASKKLASAMEWLRRFRARNVERELRLKRNIAKLRASKSKLHSVLKHVGSRVASGTANKLRGQYNHVAAAKKAVEKALRRTKQRAANSVVRVLNAAQKKSAKKGKAVLSWLERSRLVYRKRMAAIRAKFAERRAAISRMYARKRNAERIARITKKLPKSTTDRLSSPKTILLWLTKAALSKETQLKAALLKFKDSAEQIRKLRSRVAGAANAVERAAYRKKLVHAEKHAVALAKAVRAARIAKKAAEADLDEDDFEDEDEDEDDE